MLRNLNLYIDTGRKPIEIAVHIDKITDAKTILNTVHQGRRVRTVTVLTKDDVEKITKIEDIEMVVDRSETGSGLEIQAPDGTTSIVTLDKRLVSEDSVTQNRNLQVIAVVPSRTIKPYQFEGASYEMSIYGKTVKKVKVIDGQQSQMFNILYHGLNLRDEMFIVRYVSFGREKFAAIYPVDHNPVTGNPQATFIMSNLIHSSYYRNFSSQQVLPRETFEIGLRTTLGHTPTTTSISEKVTIPLPPTTPPSKEGMGEEVLPPTTTGQGVMGEEVPPPTTTGQGVMGEEVLPPTTTGQGVMGEEVSPPAPTILYFYDKIVKTLPTTLKREAYLDKHELKLKELVTRMSAISHGKCVDEETESVSISTPTVIIPDHLKMLMDL